MPEPMEGKDSGESPFSTIEEAIGDIREGRIVILVDDEDRENEGEFHPCSREGDARGNHNLHDETNPRALPTAGWANALCHRAQPRTRESGMGPPPPPAPPRPEEGEKWAGVLP